MMMDIPERIRYDTAIPKERKNAMEYDSGTPPLAAALLMSTCDQ